MAAPSWSDAVGHRLDALDEVPDQEGRLAQLEGRSPRDQLPEDAAQHAAGQRGSEAEVRAAPAEADVLGLPDDVEAPRIGEDGLVAVGRDVEQDHLVALADRHPTELGIAGG